MGLGVSSRVSTAWSDSRLTIRWLLGIVLLTGRSTASASAQLSFHFTEGDLPMVAHRLLTSIRALISRIHAKRRLLLGSA